MSDEPVPESLWDVALRGVLAYQKTMDAIDEGRRLFREEHPYIPPPPSLQITQEPSGLKNWRKKHDQPRKRGRRLESKFDKVPPPPSMSGRLSRHRLARTLRARIVPWTFGDTDALVEEVVGVTVEEFRAHIEQQFTEGMNWANHGYWHLDHIKPVASFNHDDPDQVKKCWHFTNFQPLWGRHNSQKGAKLNYGKDTNRTDSGVAQAQPGEVQGVPAGVHAQA